MPLVIVLPKTTAIHFMHEGAGKVTGARVKRLQNG